MIRSPIRNPVRAPARAFFGAGSLSPIQDTDGYLSLPSDFIFSRASSANGRDRQQLYHAYLSNEPRHLGTEHYRNAINSSENLTNFDVWKPGTNIQVNGFDELENIDGVSLRRIIQQIPDAKIGQRYTFMFAAELLSGSGSGLVGIDSGGTDLTTINVTGPQQYFAHSRIITATPAYVEIYLPALSRWRVMNCTAAQTTGRDSFAPPRPLYGLDVVENGFFPSGITGWEAHNSAILTHDVNRLQVESNGTLVGNAYQLKALEVGASYRVSADFVKGGTVNGVLAAGTTPGSAGDIVKETLTVNGNYEIEFEATAEHIYIRVGLSLVLAGEPVYFDNVIIDELSGNQNLGSHRHASAINASTVDANGLVTFAEGAALAPIVEGGSLAGVLIEHQATNLIPDSVNFNGGSFSGGAILTENLGESSLQGESSWTLEDKTVLFNSSRFSSFTLADDNSRYIVSTIIKKQNTPAAGYYPSLRCVLSGGTSVIAEVVINPQTGALVDVTGLSPLSSFIEENPFDPSEWIVLFIVENNASGNISAQVNVAPARASAFDGSTDIAALGTITCTYLGFEKEVAVAAASSPIITDAGSGTRDTDLLSFTSDIYANFTVLLNFVPAADGADYNAGFSSLFGTTDSGGAADQINVAFRSSGAGGYGYVHATGGGTFYLLDSDIQRGVVGKWGFSLKQLVNNVKAIIVKDGATKLDVSVAGTLNHSDTDFFFGSDGTNACNGAYSEFTLYKSALNEVKLQMITAFYGQFSYEFSEEYS